MSTYFYLRCLDHDPAIMSDDEVSQHDDEHVAFAVRVVQGLEPIPEDPWNEDWSFRRAAFVFARQHPHCTLDLVDEYNRARPIPGRSGPRERSAAERMLLRAREAYDVALRQLNAANEQITKARGHLAALDAMEAEHGDAPGGAADDRGPADGPAAGRPAGGGAGEAGSGQG